MAMTEEREREDTGADGEDGAQSVSFKSPDNDAKEKDRKLRNKPLTKIVIRRLPPTMTEEAFLEQVSPVPEHDYLSFIQPDPSLGSCGFSRAYINFLNLEDIYLFKDKFDGYVFVDEKGVEYVGIVEYAPFQRIPKRRKKKDPKCGTLESDPAYIAFLESLREPEAENREPKLEYSYQVNETVEKRTTSTPLLEYLAARKLDKRGREERRRRDTDKRRVRVDRKGKEAPIQEEEVPESEVKKIKARDWDKDKVPNKKKDDDLKSVEGKDKSIIKPGGKGYREQRKLAEEQRKKPDGDKKEFRNKDASYSDSDKSFRRERRDKPREPLREQKTKEVKKYSDSRKDRTKYDKKDEVIEEVEADKSEKKSSKTLSHSDIKPFTQLPQVKTDDLTKVIEEMDRMMKLEEKSNESSKHSKETNLSDLSGNKDEDKEVELIEPISKTINRRKSLDSVGSDKDDQVMNRQNSLEDRSKSTDRENSIEKDKSNSGSDPRTERRIRNKDRPSLAIYQPGMGKFSKQRIVKDKDTEPQEKKDT